MSEVALDEHQGLWYREVLTVLHRVLQPSTYLEIGTLNGETLELARCKSIAIDPSFKLDRDVLNDKKLCHFFQLKSEDFFASYNPEKYLGAPVDMAFLDGLHHYEALLMDFFNTEKYCHKNSSIILHDCIPCDIHVARRDRSNQSLASVSNHPDWWAGDVWKSLVILKILRPDINISVFDAPPTGIVAITNLDPTFEINDQHLADMIEHYSNVDLHVYGLSRFHKEANVQSTERIMNAQSYDGIFA